MLRALPVLPLVLGASASIRSDEDYGRDVAPFLAKHCVECHSGPEPEADLTFEYADETAALLDPTIWSSVRERVKDGEMPPFTQPRPAEDEIAQLFAWIDAAVPAIVEEAKSPITLRRLNRAEYENTVRDLCGVGFDARNTFPQDEVGAHGFDNVVDVQSITPIRLERYLAAAEEIARSAILVETDGLATLAHFTARDMDGPNRSLRGKRRALSTNSYVHVDVHAPYAGDFVVRARAYGQQAGDEPTKMGVRIDDEELDPIVVEAVSDAPGTYDVRASLDEGPHRISLGFINDYYRPEDPDPENRDRNLILEDVELLGRPVYGAFQRKLFADPERTRRDVLRDLATRTYRRPPTESELDRLEALSPADVPLAPAVRRAFRAMLAAPQFLFHTALPTEGTELGRERAKAYALASRLSYFLWGSMPDDELFELAATGRLTDPSVLDRQVARMLKDARANALVDGFATRWLQLRSLAYAAPDPTRFPDFDPALREAMRAETEMYFEAILRENRPVTELIDSDFTFVNERLAKHYGMGGVRGDRMRRVRLPDDAGRSRGGLLTQASVLTLTSYSTRTSPVLRGKWILETILGTPPPPPPPGAGDLPDAPKDRRGASLRQRMEEHRSDPACYACHARMDPLGFGLEVFDATGATRTTDGGFPIDSTGELPDGTTFDGPTELKAILLAEEQFLESLVERLMVYALGRSLSPEDLAAVEGIATELREREPTLSDIIREIVRWEGFRALPHAGSDER